MTTVETVVGTNSDDTFIVGTTSTTIFGGSIDFDVVLTSGDFNGGTNQVIRIDGQTGEILEAFDAASAPFINGVDGITQLNDPRDIFLDGPYGALSTTVLVNTGFVPATDGNDFTLRFTQQGDFLDTFVDLSTSNFFVNPGGAVFGTNGNIFVGSRSQGTVFEFDGATGEFVSSDPIPLGGFFDPAQIDFPRGFVFAPDGRLFIGNGSNPVTGEGEDNIFAGPVLDQSGKELWKAGEQASDQDLLTMRVLVKGVSGKIPQ